MGACDISVGGYILVRFTQMLGNISREGSGILGGVRRAEVWEQRTRLERQVRLGPMKRKGRASGRERGSLSGGDI